MSNITQFKPGGDCDPCIDTGDIDQCWRQIKALRQIIEDILGELGGPIKTGPIQGVTDGSDALPGRVGEWRTVHLDLPFPVGDTNTVISPMVLQPGDWDIAAEVNVPFSVEGVYFGLTTPLPTGVSGSLGANVQLDTGTLVFESITCLRERGSFKVPTLLPFFLNVKGATAAGTVGFGINARRMR
jgi:hypothetical protein